MEIEQFLARDVAVNGPSHVANVTREPFAAAVVVHHHLQEVRIFMEFRKVLFGAINGVKRIVVPDVPAHSDGGLHRLHLAVHGGVGLAQTVGPKHFPCQEFRIAQHQAPEGDIVTVHRPFALA